MIVAFTILWKEISDCRLLSLISTAVNLYAQCASRLIAWLWKRSVVPPKSICDSHMGNLIRENYRPLIFYLHFIRVLKREWKNSDTVETGTVKSAKCTVLALILLGLFTNSVNKQKQQQQNKK